MDTAPRAGKKAHANLAVGPCGLVQVQQRPQEQTHDQGASGHAEHSHHHIHVRYVQQRLRERHV